MPLLSWLWWLLLWPGFRIAVAVFPQCTSTSCRFSTTFKCSGCVLQPLFSCPGMPLLRGCCGCCLRLSMGRLTRLRLAVAVFSQCTSTFCRFSTMFKCSGYVL
jgi:hypothetical protein